MYEIRVTKSSQILAPGSELHTHRARLRQPTGAGIVLPRNAISGTSGRRIVVWRFRSPHHFRGKSEMRTSEPKPHQVNKLLVSFSFPKFASSVPHSDANFGTGTLAMDGR